MFQNTTKDALDEKYMKILVQVIMRFFFFDFVARCCIDTATEDAKIPSAVQGSEKPRQ